MDIHLVKRPRVEEVATPMDTGDEIVIEADVEQDPKCSFLRLPTEEIEMIMRELDPRSFSMLVQTCPAMYGIGSTDKIMDALYDKNLGGGTLLTKREQSEFVGKYMTKFCPLECNDDQREEFLCKRISFGILMGYDKLVSRALLQLQQVTKEMIMSCIDNKRPTILRMIVHRFLEHSIFGIDLYELAISNGMLEVFQIMKEIYDHPLKDVNGVHLLHVAAKKGSTEIVQFIISEDVDVNAIENGGCTALHLAVECSSESTVLALIECGADVNYVRGNGATPFLVSVHTSEKSISKLLLGAGADPFASALDGVNVTAYLETL